MQHCDTTEDPPSQQHMLGNGLQHAQSSIQCQGVCHSLLITLNPPINDIFQPINLFTLSADQLYGPITTMQDDRQLTKNIPWVAFALDESDWAHVLDAKMILAMSFN